MNTLVVKHESLCVPSLFLLEWCGAVSAGVGDCLLAHSRKSVAGARASNTRVRKEGEYVAVSVLDA